MKSLILLRYVTAVCFSVGISLAQVKDQSPKQKYVAAPRDSTLITVASQMDCPLQIENAQLLLNTDTSWDFRILYQLRNRGDKPIRSYSVMFLTSEGTGGTINDNRLHDQLVLPSRIIAVAPEEEKRISVPLTDDLREKLKFGPPMKVVVVLVIENVEFADGTRFSDAKTAKALREYFQA